MRDKQIKEGLADLAQKAEHDHEVQMARADLYKIAKYAIKLHDMLKTVSEDEGLQGWQQSKITKASDYISSVYHNLDYETKFGDGENMDPEMSEGKISKFIRNPGKEGAKAASWHKDTTGSPKDMQDGIGKMSDKELLDLMRGDNGKAPSGSAQSAQMKMVRREIKRRGLGEGKYKNDAQRKAVHAAKDKKKKNEDAYKSNLAAMLERKLSKDESKKKKNT